MATDTRSGFRLPWGAGAGEPDDQPIAGVAPGAEEDQEPAMIETVPMPETAVTPESSNGSERPAQSMAETDTGQRSARHPNKFMLELSRAMQAAVETARTETMARFELEAKAVIDEIQAGATSEAAGVRSKADEDVAAIREWSKGEIARIREETESRIAARKAALETELVDHAETIEARTARVSTVVAAYEAELAAFFERLNAEEDPTRIATMAETMPEPPSLADVAASVSSPSEPSPERLARLFDSPEHEGASTEVDFAAAEAEAASFGEDLASETDSEVPATETVEAGQTEDLAAAVELAPAELASTRVVVSGLVSVANIANFKRSLGRVEGVSTIAVASGRDGDFAFTVRHTLGSSLSAAVKTLPGFDIEITGETEGTIVVAASDRDE